MSFKNVATIAERKYEEHVDPAQNDDVVAIISVIE